MPPHCDSKDGPVVKAAISALESGDVSIVLPYVPEAAEEDVSSAFEKVMLARAAGGAAAEVVDEWFFETVVRLHRAGKARHSQGSSPRGWGMARSSP